MATPEGIQENHERESLNSSASESLRLMYEELSRRPFIKNKKIFFASSALGLLGLVSTIHEARHFMEFGETDAIVQDLGGQWYSNLSSETKIKMLESIQGDKRLYTKLGKEKIAYINEFGDKAYDRGWRAYGTIFTLPITCMATLFGSSFAFFWGLMDQKRTRNENIYRTTEGKLAFKS
ncbi:hypothetical protein A3B39_01505 [Candidatus Daviesbacteria bacterium RIFCSPLOWO2_01_FULL_37_10]|nr:MAG: hypothetical protein A3B39_01505 [Candidatus Daviesbacteria bacterium RIFCSPLOWO2_01_FULL_37_10]